MSVHHPVSEPDRLFLDYQVWFDPARQENTSLYLFGPQGSEEAMEYLRTALIDANLWELDRKKLIREDQRQAYTDQLSVVEVIGLGAAGLFAGRFNHPKFQSSATQWEAWKSVLQHLRC